MKRLTKQGPLCFGPLGKMVPHGRANCSSQESGGKMRQKMVGVPQFPSRVHPNDLSTSHEVLLHHSYSTTLGTESSPHIKTTADGQLGGGLLRPSGNSAWRGKRRMRCRFGGTLISNTRKKQGCNNKSCKVWLMARKIVLWGQR